MIQNDDDYDHDADRRRALISSSQLNERIRATRADSTPPRYEWTPEAEAELVQNAYGSEAERLDRLQAEHDARMRRS